MFSRAQESTFFMGTGDVIVINIYGEPDLNQRVRIDKTGDIRMPFIGMVNAIGKTAGQLAAEIEAAYLDGYLVEPNVNGSLSAAQIKNESRYKQSKWCTQVTLLLSKKAYFNHG